MGRQTQQIVYHPTSFPAVADHQDLLSKQKICIAASSALTYDNEHQPLLIPSLTLWF